MAVPSKTDVCNLALLYMGVSQSLTDADTDTSREAVSLRVVWDMERRFVLRDFAWHRQFQRTTTGSSPTLIRPMRSSFDAW